MPAMKSLRHDTIGKKTYHINKDDVQLCKKFLKMLEDNQ